ncbi:MAG: PAS domain-containing protein, partial [Betaproteobacteria bacterium]
MSSNPVTDSPDPGVEPGISRPSVLALDPDNFSLAAPVAAQDRAFVGKHLYSETVRLLYRFSLVGYLAELIVTFLLGVILWDTLGTRPELFAWFAAMFVAMLARYGNYKWFIKRNPRPEALPTWERRFFIGSILIGLLWGLMGSVLLPKAGPTQMPVMMLLALLTLGSVAYYAPHKSLFFYTAMASLLPMGIVTFGFGDRAGSAIGASIIIFVGLLVAVHSKVHKALMDSLTARFDNLLIAMRLEEEKIRVEKANAALETETSERRKAERAELLALQRLRLHLERTPLGVIEWDTEFRITTWNPSAEGIFGYAAAESIGESGYMLVEGVQDSERMA